MSDIQAVIFDVGGVLNMPADLAARDPDLEKLATEQGLGVEEMWRLLYHSDEWKLARTGQITDQEFWNRSLPPLGITDPADQADFVLRLFAHEEVNPSMQALLTELYGRTRLAIISNATDILETVLEVKLGISHYFEVVVNSARVGFAKPDPEIFHIALERLNLRPEQTVFTDDQQHNVDAAAQLGMHAVRFTGVADLRAYLADLGI
jgi:putative hydrolase of the HAD superfamily